MSNFNKMVSNFVSTNSTTSRTSARRNFVEDTSFVNALKQEQNWKRTENGAIARESTCDKLYDLFALGAAYRQRSEQDCILLFKEAYAQNPAYALKCLWYIRDVLEGQGERRFFRVCLKWLANYDKRAVLRNLETIARDGFGRWDDLFVLFDTPCEEAVMSLIEKQLTADLTAYQAGAAVSLLAKWAPSENSSSTKTKHDARRIITALHITPREYRKVLSALRERIKVVERLMSQNRWTEIEFDKLPSRAGLIYRNAFARHGAIAEKYREFAQDATTTVNAGTLYPYDIIRKAIQVMHSEYYWFGKTRTIDDTERLMVNKYWENQKNYLDGWRADMMVVCDTSGSMTGQRAGGSPAPIDIAVSLAIYAAERAEGPFKNHYISFSREAKLVEIRGVDFCDKVDRIVRENLCQNTCLESVFDLVLNTAMSNRLPQSAVPKTLVICSDMEVDAMCNDMKADSQEVFMGQMRKKWNDICHGKYVFPNIVYWNCDSRESNTFIDNPRSGVTFISGASPVLFSQVIRGISGQEIMWDKLNSDRYEDIA